MVRSEAGRADEVRSSDNPAAALIGFSLRYPGGNVQHSVTARRAKEWEPFCRELKALFMSAEGRIALAAAMKEGRPFHEDCGQCLVSHVMES